MKKYTIFAVLIIHFAFHVQLINASGFNESYSLRGGLSAVNEAGFIFFDMAYKNKEDQENYRKKWLKSKDRPKAKCHSEKPLRARGMCDKCYDRWSYKYSKKHRNAKLKAAKLWRSKNREKYNTQQNNARLLRLYGIDELEYQKMFSEQNGVCKICKNPSGKRRFNVDHCHKTGKIRGLLCLQCNGLLALLEKVLNRRKSKWYSDAIKYLEDEK